MKIYDVLLAVVQSAKVEIEAENAQKAEDIAFERFLHGEIELTDSGVPGVVNISVSEAGTRMPSSPGMVSIYWNDLTTEKQAEILAAFGENCNFDVFPIANIPISEEDAE